MTPECRVYRPNSVNVLRLAPPPADPAPKVKPEWVSKMVRRIPAHRKATAGAHSPGMARLDRERKPECPHTAWCHNGMGRIKCRKCSESRRGLDLKTATAIISGMLPVHMRQLSRLQGNWKRLV